MELGRENRLLDLGSDPASFRRSLRAGRPPDAPSEPSGRRVRIAPNFGAGTRFRGVSNPPRPGRQPYFRPTRSALAAAALRPPPDAPTAFPLSHLALTLRPKTSAAAARDCWNAAVSRIRETLPAREYRIWFAPTRFLGVDGDAIRILVPNRTFVAKLENGYGALLRETLSQCGAPSTAIRFRISGTPILSPPGDDAEPQVHPITPDHTDSILREPGPELLGNGRRAGKQTFESFVVGESNRFAHDAARAVSDAGAEYSPYSPLVIYGETGLGKTHLLNAIRHRVEKQSPELRVLALKGEAFTRQVVSAALSSRLFELREWYSGVDVFLVDDIQFISGLGTFGRSTQEFLHALDALAERGRQTVLTLNCHPGEIPNLDGRLRSRMESGLAADLRPPAPDTRRVIVRRKAAAAGADLPDEIVEKIASSGNGTISELEGVVKRIVATAKTEDGEFSTPLVENLLDGLPGGRRKRVPIGDIIAATATEFGVPALRVLGKQRQRDLVSARQVAMFLAREVTEYSLKEIGEAFRRHHSTVAHAIVRVEHDRKRNPGLVRIIERLSRQLRG